MSRVVCSVCHQALDSRSVSACPSCNEFICPGCRDAWGHRCRSGGDEDALE